MTVYVDTSALLRLVLHESAALVEWMESDLHVQTLVEWPGVGSQYA